MNNKKGFTLAELLIVVAIIAVLTAIALPIFNKQLEHSREETDIANMRAGQAAAVTYFLDHTATSDANTVYFNQVTGDVQTASNGITPYGKGTAADGGSEAYNGYNNTESYVGKIVQYTRAIDPTSHLESITASWTQPTGGGSNP